MSALNRTLKSIIKLSIATPILASSFGIAYAAERDQETISLITAPFGSGSYVMGSALEDISKKYHPWLKIDSSESPGFIFNIKTLDKDPALRKNMIVGSGGGVEALAASGQKPFDKKYEAPLKLLANYSVGIYWLATVNPNIKSVADLENKKVALGRATQINWTVQPEWIMRYGYGLTKDNVNTQYLGTKEAVDALLDGISDAAILGGYVDPLSNKIALSPQTVEFIASGRKINHLSWGEEAIEKAKAQGMSMSTFTIPENTIDGLDQPIEVLADTTAWMVSSEFPEEIAYEVTKLIIDNMDKFPEYHAIGKLISPEEMIYGWDVEDIHPGALRAYKEAGIIK